MDGLLILLAIWGIISSLNRKKKQQAAAQKAQKQAEAFARAFPDGEDDEILHPKKTAKKASEPMKKVESAVKQAVQQEIPFTKEEWDRFISRIEGKKPAESKPVKPSVSPEGRGMQMKPSGEGISAPLKSTQGESEKEHKKHLERIAAAEKLRKDQAEEMQNLRSVNRQKLRQAVIMSEVLGKPVALKGRRI